MPDTFTQFLCLGRNLQTVTFQKSPKPCLYSKWFNSSSEWDVKYFKLISQVFQNKVTSSLLVVKRPKLSITSLYDLICSLSGAIATVSEGFYCFVVDINKKSQSLLLCTNIYSFL